MNNALSDLYDELNGDNLEAVSAEVKSCIEATKSDGGVGATPGKAHGGDLNCGDCLDVVIFQERWLTLLPLTWSRRDAWCRYFSCLKFILPPLLRSRFWSDDEINQFEEIKATFYFFTINL